VPPPWCPDYFRHIHTDLEPWRTAGITRDAVERAQRHAELRLVVVSGRAYVEKYRPSYQTRDVFTEWGILQLLARYPGRVPDVDMMFATGDVIRVRAADYHDDPSATPPLFRYCKDVDKEVAILWPDWSFWGWSEVNIRPWAPLIKEVGRENARHPWRDREPYAFWKGNPGVSEARRDLFRCNNDSAAGKDWNARLFAQNWAAAVRNGFKDSSLAKQCRYRYKIYVAGRAWSVSEKYILACDSPMLALDTPYRDFFSRGLVAGKHYWPIDLADKCRAIKFAVDWGNAHPEEARRMGQEGSGFAREEMDMELVYEYMLHVLTQYAALLRYKPTVPEKAVELCPESMACPRRGRERDFMMESREKYVATCEPCTLPPPFTADEVLDKAVRDDGVRSKLLHKMDRD
jgi:protein glucosyltransferase